jgi:Pyridoxamine 5'-phosphate oxidase
VARWREIVEQAPEFAEAVRAHLDAHIHKTIATLRADGSPRISGTEAFFAEGDIWIGSMPNARKALDLRRDPRYALHSASVDPPDWLGDAKLSGRAEEITDQQRRLELFRTRGSDPPSSDSHLFRLDVEEAVIVGLSEARDRLVIQLWRPGRPLKRIER